MKKLIAISVMLALVAGAVFAQTTFSGGVDTAWVFLKGATGQNADAVTKGPGDGYAHTEGVNVEGYFFQFSAQSDDGTYGAIWQFNNGNPMNRAYIFWRPVPQVEIRLGRDGDGWFEMSNLARWGYLQMPRNISVENWNAQDFMVGGAWDIVSLAAVIKPVDGLTINLAVSPAEGRLGIMPDDEEDQNAFGNFQAQAIYNIGGVGTIGLAYKHTGNANANANGAPLIGLSYKDGGFVEGLEFELGVSMQLGDETWGGAELTDAVRFGFGMNYNYQGMWGVKARGYFQLMDAYTAEVTRLDANGEEDKREVKVDSGIRIQWFDIMPYYYLDDLMLACNFRFQLSGPDTAGFEQGPGSLSFHINPYVRTNMAGMGDWRIGALIENTDGSGLMQDKRVTTWKIATYWTFGF